MSRSEPKSDEGLDPLVALRIGTSIGNAEQATGFASTLGFKWDSLESHFLLINGASSRKLNLAKIPQEKSFLAWTICCLE